jgi:hypothetical protein
VQDFAASEVSMLFVPFVPPQEMPSARAEDLSRRISALIDEQRRHDPSLGGADILAALRLVRERTPGGPDARRPLAAALGALALAAGIAVALLGDGQPRLGMLYVLIAVAVALALMVVLVARRG